MTENITINLKEYLDDRFAEQTKLHQHHGEVTKANIDSLNGSMASIRSEHSSDRSWTIAGFGIVVGLLAILLALVLFVLTILLSIKEVQSSATSAESHEQVETVANYANPIRDAKNFGLLVPFGAITPHSGTLSAVIQEKSA